MNNMKKLIIAAACCLPLAAGAQKAPQLGKTSIDKVVKAMTLEEKASLLIGTGMAGMSGNSAVVGATQDLVPGAAGTSRPVERLGIPAIVLADGPAGLRIQPIRKDDPNTYYCTAFPVATLLGSTWNTELVTNVGKAMGNEVREYGADVLLAPALNIHRNPLCGRNFEYYSEDPLLTGKITAAMVNGIQSNGVGTSIKHFAANNQETNRTANDAIISQRALREIYLKGFEITVKESQPWTVMSSYNFLNGTYTSESRDLLTTILREEWGFKGLVMTDWFGGKSVPAQVHAGNDLMMPGIPTQTEAIIQAVKDGTLSEADVDICVKRMLELIVASPRFQKYAFSNKPDLKAHAEVTRSSASEGMVLLKNNANALPLAASIKSVAAFGITSYEFIAGGTGSGDVNRAYTISLTDGLNNAGYKLNTEVSAWYTQYIAAEKEKNKPDPNNPFAAFMNKKRIEEIVPCPDFLTKQAKASDAAILTIGRSSGEFTDRHVEGDFKLTPEELSLMANVCKAFHAEGKKVIVILNIGGVIETSMWKELPDAILLAWQAGQEGGNTVADILKGQVNPSGKLPMTFPVSYMDAASSKNFPYDYVLDQKSLFANFMGGKEKKNEVRNVDYTAYEEGIFVGYRFFDTFGKQVSYPFGYGLSYTKFDYSNPSVKETKDGYQVAVTVKNTGSVAGKEVVQLYASAPTTSLVKPEKELKAFVKTKQLQPGESQTLSLTIKKGDLASFSEARSAWIADAGTYQLKLAASSRDVRQTLEVSLPAEVLVEKVHDVLRPAKPIAEIKPAK